MGTSAKAVATFGMVVLGVPEHATDILTYLVQQIPQYGTWPPMVQDGVMFFLVTLPVSAAASYIVWRVKNQPPADA